MNQLSYPIAGRNANTNRRRKCHLVSVQCTISKFIFGGCRAVNELRKLDSIYRCQFRHICYTDYCVNILTTAPATRRILNKFDIWEKYDFGLQNKQWDHCYVRTRFVLVDRPSFVHVTIYAISRRTHTHTYTCTVYCLHIIYSGADREAIAQG